MAWREAAAQVGASTLISGLKALEGTMKKRDFKRLVSTTAAQVLAVHPDVKPGKARRWVRRATGTRAAKGLVKKNAGALVKEAVEAVGVAAVSAGAAKVAGKLRDQPAVRKRAAKAIHPKEEQKEALDKDPTDA